MDHERNAVDIEDPQPVDLPGACLYRSLAQESAAAVQLSK